jgi:hypothetical protein
MLDWEENLFLGLKAIYRRWIVQPRERTRAKVAVRLRDRRQSLLLLAQMIAGRPLTIFEGEDSTLCRGDRIFLPGEFAIGPSRDANETLYEIKALLAGLAIRDAWHRESIPPRQLISRYRAEFPGLEARLENLSLQLGKHEELWNILGPIPAAREDSEPGERIPEASKDPEANPGRVTTEIDGKGSAEVTVLEPSEDGPGADMPMHTFEKVETVEEYSGLSRKSDGRTRGARRGPVRVDDDPSHEVPRASPLHLPQRHHSGRTRT